MTDEQDLAARARATIDANLYMVIGTCRVRKLGT